MKKPRFNPEITRVKLNPEQAVLVCECYNASLYAAGNENKGSAVCHPQFGKNTGKHRTNSPNVAGS